MASVESVLKSKTGSVGRFLEAAHAGNRDRVSDFIRKGIDVNATNEIGVTGLHLAAKEGHVDVVSELVKHGARVDAATRKGITALHVSSLSGKVDVIRLLLDNVAKINIQSKDGFTPLYMAAQENHVEAVRCLLSSGASQSLTTEDGFTALSVALQQGHDEVASVLLGYGTSSKLKLPQIHIAIKKGDLRAVALLLKRNEDNINTTSKSGFTPLHIAAHYGNTDIGRLLIGKGADVNFRAKNGISPLHVASKRGRSSLVSLLIDSGADVNSQTRDGISPLHCAVINSGSKVVSCLLQKGASFDAKTRNGFSALHLAVQGDHVNCAKQLLNHGAPINDVSTEQLTPLHVAAHCGNVRSVRLLLEKKCEINPIAMNGFTPLHIAAKRNHKEIVELLIKHGAKVDAGTQTGLTPLHVASFMGHSSVVSSLLRLGSNPDCTTSIGDTALHFATRNQHLEVIDQLLHSGSQVDSRAADQMTPLHIAVQNGDFESAALLLHHGATPSANTSDLNTPLHFTAAGSGKDDVTQLLLEHGASPASANKKGFSPLHVAAKHGNVRVARLLLARSGIDPNVACNNGLTPLHVAVHSNQINTALLLLEKGAKPDCQARNGYTALHIAAAENRMNLVPYLLEHHANINAESQTGFTPLHLSSKAGYLAMTSLLLERGASMDHASKDGLTPLHLVALGNRVPVAEILLQFGANINAETNSGLRPIHLANQFEQTAMVEFLLGRDAEISRVSPNDQVSISSSAEQLSTDSAVDLQGVSSDVLARPFLSTQQSNEDQWRIMSEDDELSANSLPDATFLCSKPSSSVLSIPDEVSDLFAFDLVPDPGCVDGRQSLPSPRSQIRRELAYTREDGGDSVAPADRHQHNRQPTTPSAESQQKPLQELLTLESTAEPSSTVSDNLPSCQQSCLAPDGGRRSSTAALTSNFLISFLVDARGGAMQGSRCAGVRVIVPPDTVCMPTRISCRYVRKEKLLQCPPLSDGDGLATRVLEMGPDGIVFSGPVVIEVTHFASLQDGKREVIVLRSDNGQKWFEHTESADDATIESLCGASDDSVQKVKIITHTFPRYFALITRFRHETATIGPEGGTLTSKALPDVRAIFPPGSIKRSSKVQLQVNPVADDLVAKVLGSEVHRCSPVVTIDPRHRRFHQPIALTIPLPKSMNDCTEIKRSNLRVFSSRSEGIMPAVWEDITDAIAMTILNGSATLLVTVSARFWLIDSSGKEVSLSEVTELYQETLAVPFWSKFLIFAKRLDENEARIRLFSITDDQLDRTLDNQESFTEVARSNDVVVFDGKPIQVEVTGNLLPQFDKPSQTLSINFHAFRENRLPFSVKIRSPEEDPIGQVSLIYKPKSTPDGSSEQTVICVLGVGVPDLTSAAVEEQEKTISANAMKSDAQISKAELHLTDIADILDVDWLPLAVQLGLTQEEVSDIQVDYDYLPEQALIMLHQWVVKNGEKATGNSLERALKQIGRADVIAACMHNISEVTDDRERMVAKNYIKDSDSRDELTSPRFLGTMSSRGSSARRRASSDVSYGDFSSLPESRSFCYDTGSDMDSETEKDEYRKTRFDDQADDRCFYVDGSINSSAYANMRSAESEDSDAVLSDGASDMEMGNAYDQNESWNHPQWKDVVLRRHKDEARVMADATVRLSQVSDATMTPEDAEESDRELTPCILDMALSSDREQTSFSVEENHYQGNVLKHPEVVKQKRMTRVTKENPTESQTHGDKSESSEVVLQVKKGDIFLHTDISDLEELLGDGTRVKRRTITRKQMRPVEEKLVKGNDVLETRMREEVIRIEVEEDITEFEPGIEDEFGAHLDCETTSEELEEMLEDGVVIHKKVTRVRVRRNMSVSSLSDLEIESSIGSSIGKNLDSIHESKTAGDVEDVFTKHEERKSLNDSLIPVSSQSMVSPPIQTQVTTEEANSSQNDGSTVHRLVGEVFLETEEGSEEGISENGIKTNRKITTTRHILPITEIIRNDRGGSVSKKFEIIGTEIEEEILEFPLDVDFDLENGESETSVEESEETMPDGTWIKKKTTWITVTPRNSHLSSDFGVNEFNTELNQKPLLNADVMSSKSGEQACNSLTDDMHREERTFLYANGKMDESLPNLRTNNSKVDVDQAAFLVGNHSESVVGQIASSESNDFMRTIEQKDHVRTDEYDIDTDEKSGQFKHEIDDKAVGFRENEEHKKLQVAETLNAKLDEPLYVESEKQTEEEQHSAEYGSEGNTQNNKAFAAYDNDKGLDQTMGKQTGESVKEVNDIVPSGDDVLNKKTDNGQDGNDLINTSDRNSASDSDTVMKKVDQKPAVEISFNETAHSTLLDSEEVIKETNRKLVLDNNLIMAADGKVDLVNEINRIEIDQQKPLASEGLKDHKKTENPTAETVEKTALDSERPTKEIDQKAAFDPLQPIKISDAEGPIKETDQNLNGAENQIKETAQRPTEDESQIRETEQKPVDVESQIKETEQKPVDGETQIQETEQKPVDVENQLNKTYQKPAGVESQIKENEQKPVDSESQIKEQKPVDGEGLMNAIDKKMHLNVEGSVEESHENKPSEIKACIGEVDRKPSLDETVIIKEIDHTILLDSEKSKVEVEQQLLIEGAMVESSYQPPLSTDESQTEEEQTVDSVKHPQIDSSIKFKAAEKIHGPEIPKGPELSQMRPENIYRKSGMPVSIDVPQQVVAEAQVGVESEHLLEAAAEPTLLPEMALAPTESSWSASQLNRQDDVEQDQGIGAEIAADFDDNWQQVEAEGLDQAFSNPENLSAVFSSDTFQNRAIGTQKETPSYISEKMIESKIVEMLNLGRFRHFGFEPNAPHAEQTMSASGDIQSVDRARLISSLQATNKSGISGSYGKAEQAELNAEEDDLSRAWSKEDVHGSFSDVLSEESVPERPIMQPFHAALPNEESDFPRGLLESSAVEDFNMKPSETRLGEVGCKQRLLEASVNFEFKETTPVEEGITIDSALEENSLFENRSQAETQFVRDDISRQLESAVEDDFAQESVGGIRTTEQGLGIESFRRLPLDSQPSEVSVRDDFQFEPPEFRSGDGYDTETSALAAENGFGEDHLNIVPSEILAKYGFRSKPFESGTHFGLDEQSFRSDSFNEEPLRRSGLYGLYTEPPELTGTEVDFLNDESETAIVSDPNNEPVVTPYLSSESSDILAKYGFRSKPRGFLNDESETAIVSDPDNEPVVAPHLSSESSDILAKYGFRSKPLGFLNDESETAIVSDPDNESVVAPHLSSESSDILAKYGFRSKPLEPGTRFGLDEMPLRSDSFSAEPVGRSGLYGLYTEPPELTDTEVGFLNDESQAAIVSDSNNEPVMTPHLSSESSDILAKYGFNSKPSELSAGYGINNREPEVSATQFGDPSYISGRDEHRAQPHRMSELQQDDSEMKASASEEPQTSTSTTPRSKRINFSRPERRLRKASQEGSAEGLPMSPPVALEGEHISWSPSSAVRGDFHSTVLPTSQDQFSSVSADQSNIRFPVSSASEGDGYSPSSQFENEFKSPFLRGGRGFCAPLKFDEEIPPLTSSLTRSIITPDSPRIQDVVSPVSSEKHGILEHTSAVRQDICSPVSSAIDGLPPIPPMYNSPLHSDVSSPALMKQEFPWSTSHARQAIRSRASSEREEPHLPPSPVRQAIRSRASPERRDVRSVTSPTRQGIRSRTSPMRQEIHSPTSPAWQDVHSPFSSLRRDTVSPTTSRVLASPVAEDSASVASSRRYRSPTPPSGRDFSFRPRMRRSSREGLSDLPLSLPKASSAESSLYTPTSPVQQDFCTSPPVRHDIYSPLQTTKFSEGVLDSPTPSEDSASVASDGPPRLTRQPSLLQSTLEAHARYLDAITKIDELVPGLLPNPALMGPDVTQETIKGKIRCSTSEHEDRKVETEDRTIMKKSTLIQYFQPVSRNYYRSGILIDARNSEVMLGKYVDEFIYDSPTDLTNFSDLNGETSTSVDVSEETLADGTWLKHKTTRVVVGPSDEQKEGTSDKNVTSGKSSTQDFPRIHSSLNASDLLPLLSHHPVLIPEIISRLGLQSADSDSTKIPLSVDTSRSRDTLSGKELVTFLLAERRQRENAAAESKKPGALSSDFEPDKELSGNREELIQGNLMTTEEPVSPAPAPTQFDPISVQTETALIETEATPVETDTIHVVTGTVPIEARMIPVEAEIMPAEAKTTSTEEENSPVGSGITKMPGSDVSLDDKCVKYVGSEMIPDVNEDHSEQSGMNSETTETAGGSELLSPSTASNTLQERDGDADRKLVKTTVKKSAKRKLRKVHHDGNVVEDIVIEGSPDSLALPASSDPSEPDISVEGETQPTTTLDEMEETLTDDRSTKVTGTCQKQVVISGTTVMGSPVDAVTKDTKELDFHSNMPELSLEQSKEKLEKSEELVADISVTKTPTPEELPSNGVSTVATSPGSNEATHEDGGVGTEADVSLAQAEAMKIQTNQEAAIVEPTHSDSAECSVN